MPKQLDRNRGDLLRLAIPVREFFCLGVILPTEVYPSSTPALVKAGSGRNRIRRLSR
jgi:hypothetical protein